MSRLRIVVAGACLIMLLGGCVNDSRDRGESTPAVSGKATAELASAIADANRMAPALESAVRGSTYPMTLAEARRALVGEGIEPTAGNVVNGYVYDPDSIEFTLCIEGPTGAHASYDTKPMSLFTTGESGGCPTP